jgi:hypothetical protein
MHFRKLILDCRRIVCPTQAALNDVWPTASMARLIRVLDRSPGVEICIKASLLLPLGFPLHLYPRVFKVNHTYPHHGEHFLSKRIMPNTNYDSRFSKQTVWSAVPLSNVRGQADNLELLNDIPDVYLEENSLHREKRKVSA